MQLQIKKVINIESEVSDEKLYWKEDNLEPKLHGKANGEELEG